MSNILKTAAVAAFALFTFAAQVQADPIVSPKAECKNNTCDKFRVGMYRVRDTMSMNVMMEKERGEKVAIRLMDSKGKLLHEEFVPKYITKTGRKISFDEMGDGLHQKGGGQIPRYGLQHAAGQRLAGGVGGCLC